MAVTDKPPHPAAAHAPGEAAARLRRAVSVCRACDLWARATQGVWGDGPRHAPLMLVGEQPGDREDLIGRPFVGPAGALLDQALDDAGIDRAAVYVTNAVKHFKWHPDGKRRLHERPRIGEIRACRPWLQLELAGVRPDVVVALGAVAARSLLGPGFRLTKERGRLVAARGRMPAVLATHHPSAILRARDRAARHERYRLLVDDLRTAVASLPTPTPGARPIDRSGRCSG